MVIGVGGRKEMIATKDKDVFMTCVVHNKPANKKVRNHDLCSPQQTCQQKGEKKS